MDEMTEKEIIYTALDLLLKQLCLDYYNEIDPVKRKSIFDAIQELYLKKTRKKYDYNIYYGMNSKNIIHF